MVHLVQARVRLHKNYLTAQLVRTALIQQDHYRFIFKPSAGGSKTNAATIHKMIEQNCISALEDGYDFLLDGIFSVRSYEAVLGRIMMAHNGLIYMFYFDVSFEETAQDMRALIRFYY